MKIVVLGGGDSVEREVSLRSSKAVAEALKKAGYEVGFIDPKNGFNQFNDLATDTMVFPILHGAGGEDGIIQAELEQRGLPYLGTKSEDSKVCFDKELTRQKLIQANFPVAKGEIVDETVYWNNEIIKGSHVLKVARGGSSIGTYIVHDPGQIDKQKVKDVFSLDNKAVLEELVEGVEITVPILDNKALPVIEIRPPENEDFNYQTKYDGSTQEICPPKSVDKNTQVKAQELAEQVHTVLGARHLSRIDIIVSANNDLTVLELNTMPGMTDQSLYPKSAAAAGIPMTELVKKFAGLVERDYNINNQ